MTETFAVRSLACLTAILVAGCGAPSSPDQQSGASGHGGAPASFSPAERRLLDGGTSQARVLAARAFIVPFTRTDAARCFGTPTLSQAQLNTVDVGEKAPGLTRVAIAIDGSGSMAGRIGSRTKLERASEATSSFIDGLPERVPASLMVFGQQGDNSASGKASSCSAVDVLEPMSSDREKLKNALAKVRAVGWTPLANGLRAAQRQLAASSVSGEQVIYVVSDGIETCGGDPVSVARDINRGGTRAIVNIIGFGLPRGEAAALKLVAEAGGGRLFNVTDDGSFQRAMAGFREEMRLAENRVSANMTRAGNAIAAGATGAEVVQCFGQLIDREIQGALASYDARAARGETLPPRYQVVALMTERHNALAARRDAHIRLLGTSRDVANDAVEAARKAAQ